MKKNFQFMVYRAAGEDVSVKAVIKDETIWLSQKTMAELFGVQTPAISKHLKNIFNEGELEERVVVSKMEITTAHGAIPDKMHVFSKYKAPAGLGGVDPALCLFEPDFARDKGFQEFSTVVHRTRALARRCYMHDSGS